MRINYNVSAMISNNSLSQSESALSKSLQRLSSGLKINNAKDNPAGLAMAKRMNAQIQGLSVANQNAGDGISVLETADGALAEVTEMIQRINELAVKGSTGTISDDDRKTLQDEVTQLTKEIERVANETEFNGQKLLNGEFDFRGYTTESMIKVQNYSEKTPSLEYAFNSMSVTKDANGNITGFSFAAATDSHLPADASVKEIKDNIVVLSAAGGFEMQLNLGNAPTGTTTNFTDVNIDLTGIGAMSLQIGSNEGQTLDVRIPAITLENMGIAEIDLSTAAGSEDALARMPRALSYISGVRSKLGAFQNRLESTIANLDISSENMTAAYSRIMDVDMALEMTEYTKNQVLSQAGTSMLAQANERPSQVLQLLQ